MIKQEKTRLLCHLGFHKFLYVLRYKRELTPHEIIQTHPLFNAYRPFDGWRLRTKRCKFCQVEE